LSITNRTIAAGSSTYLLRDYTFHVTTMCCINNFRNANRSSMDHILYMLRARKSTLATTVRCGPAASLIILQRFRNNCNHFLRQQTVPAYSRPADDTATCRDETAPDTNGCTPACPGSVYSCNLMCNAEYYYILFQFMRVIRHASSPSLAPAGQPGSATDEQPKFSPVLVGQEHVGNRPADDGIDMTNRCSSGWQRAPETQSHFRS
jgi:hypothetical protein